MATVDTLKIEQLSLSSPPVLPEPEDRQKTPHPEPARCPATGAIAEDSNQTVCPVTGASAPPPSAEPSTQEVDPELLRTSITTRMTYLKDFLGFRRYDQDVLSKVAPLIYESIPTIVDQLYSKLFEFDLTKQVFLKRNDGFDGALPKSLEDLTLDSPQLVYRKVFMKAWARRILTSDFTSVKTFQYLDKVGIMHTGVKSFKHRAHVSPLHVPYRDCALTLGWVLTVLQTAILSLDEEKLSAKDKIDAIAAINKVDRGLVHFVSFD
ncbi:hypothetical protein NLJ89_g6974 [Agrocybe chaxingu]|uniref:Globin-sensor domain-containing protein n=1 Tax=Agrocybe chaxingu TaxID=84603 RepID=A0A9W8JY68_9AGAR|nr:hypothetical protein NLJ89_g6974 [Agrocybe chaxingu]